MTDPATGKINPNAPVGNLSIPYGQVVDPVATSAGSAAGNLSAGAADGDTVQTQITMYDQLGNAHQVSYLFTRDVSSDVAPGTAWTLEAKDGNTSLGSTTVNFDDQGAIDTTSWTFTAGWGDVDVDLSGVTQFGGAKSSVTATTPAADAGSALGTLESFALSNDGTISGVYSNGLRKPIGQLAMATFANPSGLAKAGNSSYRVGDNSGNALVGTAGTGGRGTLTAGALEMSNVDLSEEFTGLIIAQRGFQANSKVITASDELLQDLVNLKR
jgi:flagellar hook protein FlgE